MPRNQQNKSLTKKNYLDKLEQEEEYINLLYSLIGDIQNEIEESIRNGEWYQKITYEFIDGNDYDEVIVIDNELKTKVTFFVSDWGRWHHYTKQLEN